MHQICLPSIIDVLLAETVKTLKEMNANIKIILERTQAEGKIAWLALTVRFVFLLSCFAGKSVAISDVSAGDYQTLLTQCRLRFVSVTFPDPYGGIDVAAFKWSDEAEPKQEERYLAYLAQVVPLSKRHLRWKAVNDTKDLFLGQFPGYKLKGTADAAVIDTTYPQLHSALVRASLALIVEVKKNVKSSSLQQGVLELLAHASMGETAWPPLAVVTDLKDTWHFLWLNNGRNISILPGTRAQSVKFLRDLFNSDDHSVPGFQQLNSRGGLKLDFQAQSMMGAADVANLSDVMECMTEEEQRMHKAQATFNMYLQANPWLSMYG
jgi:hypothetical protein